MKYFTLLGTCLAAAAVLLSLAVLPGRLCFDDGQNYTFYCGTSSADCREVVCADYPAIARLTLSGICGESVEYENFNMENFLAERGGKVIFSERLSDSVNYYCTADMPYSIELYGSEINLHICVRENSVKVASPIIFGGY